MQAPRCCSFGLHCLTMSNARKNKLRKRRARRRLARWTPKPPRVHNKPYRAWVPVRQEQTGLIEKHLRHAVMEDLLSQQQQWATQLATQGYGKIWFERHDREWDTDNIPVRYYEEMHLAEAVALISQIIHDRNLGRFI